MRQIVYFNLKSQEDAEKLVSFAKEQIAPILKEAGCQRVHLYEAASDAISRYMLDAVFESSDAASAALKAEAVQALTSPFLELAEDVTLICYDQLC